MPRLTARDFAPEVMRLFDHYVHGRIDRRAAQARGKGAHTGNRQRRAAERGHEARHWGAPFVFFVCGE